MAMETYNGHVRTPADAILLFEACRMGLLPRVQRRLSEKERQQIKSGSVFVWDEQEAGMRRWTDGKSWSASRVSGSFLTYREMEGKRGGSFPAPAPAPKRASGRSPEGSANESDEGPDGYRYKPDGLMKQSFSITTSQGQHLHLISYFSRSHSSNLQQPSIDPTLRHIRPPKNMYPESSVNENQNVPAVTRGPMPGSGSPYTAAPQQMGSQSPYSRPGPSPQMGLIYQTYPGPPTPPYQPTYFISHGPPHLAYQQGAPVYLSAQGYTHTQQLTALDRIPPHMTPSYPPPNGHPVYQAPPHPHQMPPQYLTQMPPRGMQVDPSLHQPQPNGHQPHPQHQQIHMHHHHVPPPQHQIQQHPAPLSEHGPQLPALNAISSIAGKPPTPQPSEPKPSESLNVQNTNGTTPNAPSPSRTIPNIQTLLNTNQVDNTPSSADTSKINQNQSQSQSQNQSQPSQTQPQGPNSRSGSRSPGTTQRPPREMNIAANSRAADAGAISRLNSTFLGNNTT